jgi:hypothetical protein
MRISTWIIQNVVSGVQNAVLDLTHVPAFENSCNTSTLPGKGAFGAFSSASVRCPLYPGKADIVESDWYVRFVPISRHHASNRSFGSKSKVGQ